MNANATTRVSAAVAAVGNEVVAGRIGDENGSYIAKRLHERGVDVRVVAVLPDDVDAVADFVAAERGRRDHVFVTGGLAGTPDDVTRQGIARGLQRELVECEPARRLLSGVFVENSVYASRCSRLPEGATVIRNPLGGAPGFRAGNVWAFPGAPAEAHAMFDSVAGVLPAQAAYTWRRSYPVAEEHVAQVLDSFVAAFEDVELGVYAAWGVTTSRLDVVLRAADHARLQSAAHWLEHSLANRMGAAAYG
jgi:molybdenum cofactor synthesis domain-containing protein